MRYYLFPALLLFLSTAQAGQHSKNIEQSYHVINDTENTIIVEHRSPTQTIAKNRLHFRSKDFPTQVVRMEGLLDQSHLNCDQVMAQIDDFFTSHLPYDMFFSNTIIYCNYHPENGLAWRYVINSYFDPLDDSAANYLDDYLSTHNGRKLLGTTFKVESARSLVVSLNIDTGNKEDDKPYTLQRRQHDNAGHHFKNNYDMRATLANDTYERFYSTNPEVVLPYITTWFKTSRDRYAKVLSESNYVELRPELIFIMGNDDIFTPNLRLYYTHFCSEEKTGHCLG